ncbi:MAG: Maf family protein [Oscillospiraceae bacterium]|jgi:septum formation protein|nr:Maf family protein [Oscillospiraceae bacterium]
MLILASASPRRRELMKNIADDFEVVCLATDESLPEGTDPRRGVTELALRKARAVAKLRPADTVIGADTVVVLGGEVFGKPKDREDALRMLRALSGREHTVYTGVAIVWPQGERAFAEETLVRFAELTPAGLEAYADTGEPADKAGAYGIQGPGARLVAGITGDFYNVMGLPVCRLWRELSGLFPDWAGNANNL